MPIDPTDERALIGVAALLYSAAFAFGLVSIVRGLRYPRAVLLGLVAGGFLFQTAGLYWRGLESGSCPLGNPFEVVQFVAWSAVLLYLVIGPAFRVSLLGFFSSGLAAGLGVLSLAVPGWDGPTAHLPRDPWIEAHASTAIFSYGVFGTLALTSAMYLLQTYGLKHKRFQGLFRFLPSIVEIEQISRRLLLSGVSVLTLSLGLITLYYFGGHGAVAGAKLAATTAVWAGYLVALVLRAVNRLLAERFAWACVGLFALALLSLWPVDSGRPARAEVSAGAGVGSPVEASPTAAPGPRTRAAG